MVKDEAFEWYGQWYSGLAFPLLDGHISSVSSQYRLRRISVPRSCKGIDLGLVVGTILRLVSHKTWQGYLLFVK